jgi:hypothetical protein
MCLSLTVRAPESKRGDLEKAMRMVSPSDLRVELVQAPRWPWARDRDAKLRVSKDGGCACSLLSQDADWNADTWAMKPELLDRLARTLSTLAEHGPDEMVVEALWQGEEVKREERVTAEELAALARSSRIGTHTRYVLSSGG